MNKYFDLSPYRKLAWENSLKSEKRNPRYFRRRPLLTENSNRILLSLLYANDIKLSDLADYMFLDPSTIDGWVYRHSYIKEQFHKDKLSDLLDIDINTLFHKSAYNTPDIPELELEGINRTMIRRPTNRRIVKKVLFGLMWAHGLTTYKLSCIVKFDQDTLSRWMFTNRTLTTENAKILENLFEIPSDILLRNYSETNPKDKINNLLNIK